MKGILTILLHNFYTFDNIHYFYSIWPLITAEDYDIPVKVVEALIKSKFQGFPAEWSTLESLIVALLKEPSFGVDRCMNLTYSLVDIPDVVNPWFIVNTAEIYFPWPNLTLF